MRPLSSNSIENATSSIGTYPLVSYKELPWPSPPPPPRDLMHVNETEFERNISLEYYHVTCIRVSMRLTIGRKTAKNLAVALDVKLTTTTTTTKMSVIKP